MAQIPLGGLATLNTSTHLDPQFTQLYEMRELISSPGYAAATPKFTIDGAFNWLSVGGGAIGYGVGSGGAVTQLTSKSTAVTLNKPSGRITTHNASLAAGASVYFFLYSSAYEPTDTVVCHVQGAISGAQSYSITPFAGATGVIALLLKNLTGGALSEDVAINFVIVKGSLS